MTSRRTRLAAGAAAVILVAGTGSAVATPDQPDTMTPDGPATVRENWLSGQTAEGRPPEVLVSWRVTVGTGGKAGPVRLRVLHPGDKGTVVGSGPVEQLPAEPGTYSFGLRPGIPYDTRDAGLALDQEVGGHAILKYHPPEKGDPEQPDAVDVFRPPLPDGARDTRYTERRVGQELLIRGVVEKDLDEDRLGDKTQDPGDLRLLDAWVARRRGRDVVVRARVRNTGTTVRHLPHVALPRGTYRLPCRGARAPFLRSCAGGPLAPGAEAVIGVTLSDAGALPGAPQGGFPPDRLRVAAEGADTSPGDNAGPLTPRLVLRPARGDGRRLSVDSSHPGTVMLAIRSAGRRTVRRVRFARPGRRTVRLAGTGRRVSVTATLRDARARVRLPAR